MAENNAFNADELKDAWDYATSSPTVKSGGLLGFMGLGILDEKTKQQVEEYKALHDNGEDVKRDSNGNVVTMTPSKVAELNDAVDATAYALPRGLTDEDIQKLSELGYPLTDAISTVAAVGSARDAQTKSGTLYTPQTNAESYSRELSQFKINTEYYDNQIQKLTDQKAKVPSDMKMDLDQQIAELQQQKETYIEEALTSIQENQNRLWDQGPYGKSREAENWANVSSSATYQTQEADDAKQVRREARSHARDTISDLREQGADLQDGPDPHHTSLQLD